MARKKKISGLSMAIVALNIVIVGIIILLIVLVYFHMREDSDNGREEVTTTVTTVPGASETGALTSSPEQTGAAETAAETNVSEPSVTTEESIALPQTYNKEFFKDDLFIGDSIFTGLYLYSYLDSENVFAAVGLNPDSSLTYQDENGQTCAQKAGTMQPRNIYIMLGTNGLASLDGDYMAKRMLALIEALENACPTAKICVISIPPVTKVHDSEGNETMEKVNAYNKALKGYCDQGGYTYIDICSRLTDDEGFFSSKYAEADGLHFLGGTYQAVLGYIEKTVG